jgi:drug/metabolite transporter (DMT)-like permease
MWAILASVGYGFFFWLLGIHVTPLLGGIIPVWFGRLMIICLLPLAAPLLRQSVRLPQGQVWWYLLGAGILDTAAFVAATVGLTVGQISLVSVLASLFSPITFLLAWIFLREPLCWSQWLGICIIFMGIVLMNV